MATSKINVPRRSEIQVESPDEIHTSEECTYIKKKGRVPWWKDPIFVHIRKCRCKKGFKNREDLIYTHVTEITEFSDGVEIHQTETCGYRPLPKRKGQVKLRRTCKCPSFQQAQDPGLKGKLNGNTIEFEQVLEDS